VCDEDGEGRGMSDLMTMCDAQCVAAYAPVGEAALPPELAGPWTAADSA
jgi:hypothetical protein